MFPKIWKRRYLLNTFQKGISQCGGYYRGKNPTYWAAADLTSLQEITDERPCLKLLQEFLWRDSFSLQTMAWLSTGLVGCLNGGCPTSCPTSQWVMAGRILDTDLNMFCWLCPVMIDVHRNPSFFTSCTQRRKHSQFCIYSSLFIYW